MSKIKIGLFGFGVVGQGIYEVVRKAKNANAEIVKICVRDPEKPRKIQADKRLFTTSVEEILAFRPDGIFLSNGPGDPTDVRTVIEKVRALRGRLPIFGICMGHQLISLAYGARTFKMKFGHRGGNHPVKCLATGKIEITSQNHSFAVDIESLKGTPLTLTHVNLLDGTAEGVECAADRVFSVQYHPESAPGPQDSAYLFDKFIKMMEEYKNA